MQHLFGVTQDEIWYVVTYMYHLTDLDPSIVTNGSFCLVKEFIIFNPTSCVFSFGVGFSHRGSVLQDWHAMLDDDSLFFNIISFEKK